MALAAFRLKSAMSSRMGAFAQGVKQTGGTGKDGAVAAEKEIGDALFTRFEYARARDAWREIGGADAFERRAKAVEIQVVERDAGGAEINSGLELGGGADEEMKGWSFVRSGGRVFCGRKNRRQDRRRYQTARHRLRGLEFSTASRRN